MGKPVRIVGERLRVFAYGPGELQKRHCDRQTRISLTLAGGFAEETARQSARVRPGGVIFKTNTAAHENRFSDRGAVIAAVVFTDEEFAQIGDVAPAWAFKATAGALRTGISLFEAAIARDENTVFAVAGDLLTQDDLGKARGSSPRWLALLREELEVKSLKDVDVAARAEDAGAHPAHASRLFRRHYGSSITEHARNQSVRRAFGALGTREPLSEIALASGFYDQSHMNRVFKRVLGRTPAQCRRLMSC